jgi:hypothetical protein
MKEHFPRLQRIFDALERLPLYEVAGRRPSAVFLDDALTPTPDPKAAHRLHEPVFRRSAAAPGDQICLTSGQTLLVDSSQTYRAVLLSEPQALPLEGALGHAQRVRKAEAELVERLIREGKFLEVTLRQPKEGRMQRQDELFRADTPLVIEALPSRDARAPQRARK